MSLKRRTVLQLATALPAFTLLNERTSASQPQRRRIFVYEPTVPGELWRPLAAHPDLIEAVPLTGDPVRFARACLARAPGWIGGVIRPQDLLVLAGSAEEEGFRMLTERRLHAPTTQHLVFSMQRRRT